MSSGPLRLVVAAVILLLLLRAGAAAWRQRALVVAVWRTVTWRHVTGALGLLVVVASLGSVLLLIPLLDIGLGEVVGFTGNAVFTPLEEAVVRSGPAPASGPDWALIGLATAFLGFLATLLPWLAFVEEEIFRAGLEHADLKQELWTALRFGLVHMIMLVPLGAALAIAVAGFVYGRLYRSAYARSDAHPLPAAAAVTYRPTRSARRAAAVTRLREAYALLVDERSSVATAPTATVDPSQRQAAAVFASTVWHTAFNTTIVAFLWLLVVAGALVG